LIKHFDLKIGAVLTIPAGGLRNEAEITVTLRPSATLTGRLVDGAGKPVSGGVRVELTSESATLFEQIPAASAELDSDGRFHCDNLPPGRRYQVSAANNIVHGMGRRMEPEAFKPFMIARDLTLEAGQALDFGTIDVNTGQRIKDAASAKTTRADVPITGRIVDLEGRPVTGATIRIMSYATSQSDDLNPWLDAVQGDQPAVIARQHLNHFEVPSTSPWKTTTDQQGRFRFAGFGAERVAHLLLEGPTIASAFFTVVTRPIKSFRAGGFSLNHGPGTETIHGADFTFSAAPGRPVEGIIRDARTRKPLPRVVVRSSRRLQTGTAVVPHLETASDDQGRFRLVGLSKERASPQGTIVGNQNVLTVLPNDDQPYLMRNVPVPDPPGIEPVSMEIELHRGIWITGRVTDKKSGQPVTDVSLNYLPFLENKFAQAVPEFGPNRSALVVVQDRYKTNSDGEYRLVGLPGRAIVGAAPGDRLPYRFGFGSEAIKGMDERGQFATWWNPFPPGKDWPLSMKEINPAEGTEAVHVDLDLDPGASVRVRVVDGEGKPLSGSSVTRRMSTSNRETMPQADFDVLALGPDEERTILVQLEGRKLGRIVRIHPGDDKAGPVVVTLERLATIVGRIADSGGDPVSGATVRARALPFGSNDPALPAVATDKDGRFLITDVPAGADYSLLISSRGNVRGRRTSDIKVRPGESSDIGTLDLNTGKRLTDAQPVPSPRADVPITGRIVDLEGQPVAGALVKAGRMLTPKSGDLGPWLDGVKKAEPPWVAVRHVEYDSKVPERATRQATTDNDGRFRLEGLGAERVVALELQGGRTAFTTIEVATRKMGPMAAAGFANMYGPGKQTIYGADFTYTAAPSRPIDGLVKDGKTGQPLADVDIRSERFAGSDFGGVTTLKTKTDKDGRFRLEGMPKGRGNELIVVPNDEQPYFMQELDVPDSLGAGPVSVELAMERGVWIEGTLTEKATGKPVPEAWFHYLPFRSNKFVQQHSAFVHGTFDGTSLQQRYKSKSDGTFKLVGLPGRAIVGAMVYGKQYLQGAGSESIEGMNQHGHFETYHNPITPGRLWPTVMKEIDPPADVKVVHVDLQVTTGPSVRVTAVDPDGKPISGLNTRGRSGRSSYERDSMSNPETEVTNLMPGEQRIVLLHHEGRRLGKLATVKKDDDTGGPVVVKLAPLATISGRVLDADGNPIAGATIRPDVLPSGDFGMHLPQVVSGADGRFRVSDVPTGCDYGLAVETNAAIERRKFVYHPRASVKTGETTEVGDIKFKRD
jgi:protocatechuate 3,4-dioxygenase beta subunit